MRKVGISFIAALALLSAFTVSAKDTKLPDSAIVQLIIDHSISAYSGNCPCPYNLDRAGRSPGTKRLQSSRR